MQSPICYNINAQGVRDKPRLLAHLERLNPAWVLVMDGVGLAAEIKRLLPDCNVIHRTWPDDGVPGAQSAPITAQQVLDNEATFEAFMVAQALDPNAEAWVAQRKAEFNGADLWAYTTNEPPATPALFDWHVRAMDAARAAGLKLVVCNFAAGQPNAADWPRAHEMLRLLAAYPEQFVMGLHEYGCAFALSGAPGFEALIPTDKWPVNPRALGPLHHCGRFQFLMDYCRDQGMRPPRIVVTEAGFDDLTDVAEWRNTLHVTPPYAGIRGWKTLPDQWRTWWPGWTAERAYGEQLDYLWRALYEYSPVEALLLFTWSSAAKWEQFDVSEADDLQAYLEARMSNVVDVNPGVSDPRWQPHTAKSAPAGTILRLNPSVASTAVTVLLGDVAVQHIPFDALTESEQARAKQGGYTWQVLKVDQTQAVGWARGDVITLTPKPVQPPAPPPVEPPPDTYITAVQLQAVVDALRAEIQAWARKEFVTAPATVEAIDNRVIALSNRMAAAWLNVDLSKLSKVG
jgi:hypothetical protein